MKNSEDITELFGQVAQLQSCAYKQDCSLTYARIADRVISAMKTMIAHSHILVIKNECYSEEAEEKYDLLPYVVEFITALLPPLAGEQTEDPAATDHLEYDETEYDREDESSMMLRAIPELIENYSDFPDLREALETIEKLIPHLDQWRESIRQHARAPDAAAMSLELDTLIAYNQDAHLIFYQDIPREELLKEKVEKAKKSMEERRNSHDMTLFLPSGPD